MQSKRYTLIFYGTLILFLLIGFFVSFISFDSVKYFEYSSSVYVSEYYSENENTGVYSTETTEEADRILEEIKSSEFEEKYNQYRDEYYKLLDYIRARKMLSDAESGIKRYPRAFTEKEAQRIAGQYSLSEAEAKKRLELVSVCIRQLCSALQTQKYISEVKKNAEKMNETALFSTDTKKKIIHAGSEFYRLENVEISAVSDNGISLVFSDRITDVLVLIMALISAFVLSLKIRMSVMPAGRRNSGAAGFITAFALSVCMMYALNYICADITVGTGSPYRSVQSVHDFVQCPFPLSVGEFVIISILIKSAAFTSVFLTVLSFFLTGRKVLFASAAVLFVTEEIFRFRSGSRISAVTLFNPEDAVGRYGSTEIFGEYFSTGTLFGIYAVLAAAVSLFISAGCIRSSAAAASEKAEKEYFEEITVKYNESRMIRHDIKNHLSAIAVLLDSGNTEGARKYIGDISGELESIKPPVKTGSDVLDALIFRKYSFAAEKGIRIYTEFLSDFENSRFSDYDLCSIFSNLLDNAFEACQGFEESRRFVSLSVMEQMNMVCITCENHFSEIKRSADGFISLKSDKSGHGLGLKSISGKAQKYGGSVDIETDDGIFSVSVLLMK